MTQTPMLDIPENVREYADTSVEQAKKAFDEFMAAVEQASESADSTSSELQTGMRDANRKMLEITKDNITASFDLAQKVVHAKDPSEIMQLQMAYIQACASAIGGQSRDFQEQFMKAMSMFGGPKG